MLSNFLPIYIKKYIRKKLRLPEIQYQNIFTEKKLKEYHSKDFNFYHEKFSYIEHLNVNKKDKQTLTEDLNVTRFRNYINFIFADYAIRKNPIGNFMSVGVSYGTTAKVITHMLDNKIKKSKYFLLDNYQNVGNNNFNTDVNLVKKDLSDIKNFEFLFIKELLNTSSLSKVEDNLIFSHLNANSFETESKFLSTIIDKTKSDGVLIYDHYGWLNENEQEKIDNILNSNSNIQKIVMPSLQLILIKH